jgi:hypothetical protein
MCDGRDEFIAGAAGFTKGKEPGSGSFVVVVVIFFCFRRWVGKPSWP